MTRGGRYARVAAGFAAFGIVVGGVTACSPDEEPEPTESSTSAEPTETATETPSPTASETETPTLTPEEQNIEAAKLTVVEYYAALGRVGAASYATWQEELAHFWGPDLQAPLTSYYEQMAATGERTEGDVALSSFQVTLPANPEDFPMADAVVCVDSSAVTSFEANGEQSERPSTRFPTQVRLQKQSDVFWTIEEIEPQPDQTC
ncbi:hypothetical protein [Litorihabitans aurantiacus]|uniref:Lipoprotein n=1 Tax=Litorihabitans aurantiacus TaxID=1930061 RepID=A0AA38CRY1_9MICO|nr:hypothetical protein [Litorihabitans aurantiacus]GMA33203.1 hypothetical protein GCM10025875_31950 [Litorihabitans aurantiacus]